MTLNRAKCHLTINTPFEKGQNVRDRKSPRMDPQEFAPSEICLPGETVRRMEEDFLALSIVQTIEAEILQDLVIKRQAVKGKD